MSEVLAGRYRLDGELGRGSMGVVHRAFDEVLGREVALKELVSPEGLDVSEAVDRFLVEARAAARLRHGSIVTVHDVVEDGGRVLMAMELLEGSTLHGVLAEAGRLDAASVRQVVTQVASALAEAHSQGVVHRDLKPENVFWLPNGRVVVCDFGLARIGAGRGTQMGTVMGTPGYMAPEQVRGEEVGPAADVFALGAIAYELLAGRPPFGDAAREDAATLLYRVVNENPAPLEVPDDPGLAQLVAWCLVKDPAQRPQQATEVLEVLGEQTQVPTSLPLAAPAVSSVPPAGGSQPPRTDRRFNPLVLAGGGLALVLVALVVVLVMVASGGGDDTVTVTTAQRFDTASDGGGTSPSTSTVVEADDVAADEDAPEGPSVRVDGRFVAEACGTITDRTTDLVWFVHGDVQLTWSQARDWATSLASCGTGWRLPTASALQGLYDPRKTAGQGFLKDGRRYPAKIDPAFGQIGEGSWVWTDSSAPGGRAVAVNLAENAVVELPQDESVFTVRAFAVRGP